MPQSSAPQQNRPTWQPTAQSRAPTTPAVPMRLAASSATARSIQQAPWRQQHTVSQLPRRLQSLYVPRQPAVLPTLADISSISRRGRGGIGVIPKMPQLPTHVTPRSRQQQRQQQQQQPSYRKHERRVRKPRVRPPPVTVLRKKVPPALNMDPIGTDGQAITFNWETILTPEVESEIDEDTKKLASYGIRLFKAIQGHLLRAPRFHQVVAVAFMVRNALGDARNRLGTPLFSTFLCDDMGLGKTYSMWAFFACWEVLRRNGMLSKDFYSSEEKKDGTNAPLHLIIAPLSLLKNIQREAQMTLRWPKDFLYVYHGTGRTWPPPRGTRVVLSTAGTLTSELRPFLHRVTEKPVQNHHIMDDIDDDLHYAPSVVRREHYVTQQLTELLQTSAADPSLPSSCWAHSKFGIIVVDEVHALTSPGTKQGRMFRLLSQLSQFRLAMSGTPLRNSIIELDALAHFADPSRSVCMELHDETYQNKRLLTQPTTKEDEDEDEDVEDENSESQKQKFHGKIRFVQAVDTRAIGQLIIRRTKQEVLSLQPPVRRIIQCSLEPWELEIHRYLCLKLLECRENMRHVADSGQSRKYTMTQFVLTTRMRIAAGAPHFVLPNPSFREHQNTCASCARTNRYGSNDETDTSFYYAHECGHVMCSACYDEKQYAALCPLCKLSRVSPSLGATVRSCQEVLLSLRDSMPHVRIILCAESVRVLKGIEHGISRISRLRDLPRFWHTGEQTTKTRDVMLQDFNHSPDGSMLFASLRSVGVGLNLQCASVIIYVGWFWNAAAEHQLIARIHRLGQKERTHIIRIAPKCPIGDAMQTIMDQKHDLAELVNASAETVSAKMIKDDDELLQKRLDRVQQSKAFLQVLLQQSRNYFSPTLATVDYKAATSAETENEE